MNQRPLHSIFTSTFWRASPPKHIHIGAFLICFFFSFFLAALCWGNEDWLCISGSVNPSKWRKLTRFLESDGQHSFADGVSHLRWPSGPNDYLSPPVKAIYSNHPRNLLCIQGDRERGRWQLTVNIYYVRYSLLLRGILIWHLENILVICSDTIWPLKVRQHNSNASTV